MSSLLPAIWLVSAKHHFHNHVAHTQINTSRDQETNFNSDARTDNPSNPSYASIVIGRNQGGAQNVQNNMERWEHSFKFEIPEIHGSQVADELLNWIATVDEILEFKHVPLERCVLVLAMRFLNRAVAW
ncbi:hypothetical protein Bca4012_076214 [Brassica carinata]